MSNLSPEKKIEYLTEHIPYRIEWLVTIVERNDYLNYFEHQTEPDKLRGIVNCTANMSGVAIRVFMDFLGLKAIYDKAQSKYELIELSEDSYRKLKNSEDIHAKSLGGRFACLQTDLSQIQDQELMLDMYIAGNKSIAHLTKDDRDMDWWKCLCTASSIVKRLLKECVYDHIKQENPALYTKLLEAMEKMEDVNGKQMPILDKFPDSKYLFE